MLIFWLVDFLSLYNNEKISVEILKTVFLEIDQ